MDLREEFVMLARVEGSCFRALCRRYGISATTGYKWLARYAAEGRAGLVDRSRRPLNSPRRTAREIEERVLALRDRHPAWGRRKLRRRLQDLGRVSDGLCKRFSRHWFHHWSASSRSAKRIANWFNAVFHP